MDEAYVFTPTRRRGAIFLGGAILLITLANLLNLLAVAYSPPSPALVANLILALVAPLPLPWLIYRLRALQKAEYLISRDGIRLSWGMRLEDIPIQEVLWVRPQTADSAALVLPRFWLPGALLGGGARRLEDGSLSEIPLEFMASAPGSLVLIATGKRVFAVSPADAEAFLLVFAETTQYGSLNPIVARSTYPSFWSRRALRSPAMRIMLGAALLLNIVLIGTVGVSVQSLQTVRLVPATLTSPAETLPSATLWILPFINLFASAVEWAGGFFLYREERNRPIAYLLWAASLLLTLFFLGGLYFILQTGR